MTTWEVPSPPFDGALPCSSATNRSRSTVRHPPISAASRRVRVRSRPSRSISRRRPFRIAPRRGTRRVEPTRVHSGWGGLRVGGEEWKVTSQETTGSFGNAARDIRELHVWCNSRAPQESQELMIDVESSW